MSEKPFLFDQVFKPTNLEQFGAEAGKEDPFYKSCKLMEWEFSQLVDVMRQEVMLPFPRINILMSLFWRLVGNKISPVVMGSSVPTMSFWCELRDGKSMAVIMCPQNWHEQLASDPHMQMGALVFAASQAKDYWNHKFIPLPDEDIAQKKKEVFQRAWSNEAELLHYFQRTAPNFKPNEYQQKVIAEYPLGTLSISHNYVGRDYDGLFPPFPVNVNPT